jgi:curved DNA-binding protein
MGVKYRDYYDIMGVPRSASQDEIKAAYRKLARKYHPDVNKAKDAEEKFKELGEAYEVLRDPAKRRKYDQLGSDWQQGQDFTPPHGWARAQRGTGGGAGDFSDFFESMFGSRGGFGQDVDFSGRRRPRDIPGEDQEVRVRIPLEDVFHGAERTIKFETSEEGRKRGTRSLQIKIPRGITSGQRIRLAGQGEPGTGRGAAGDLLLLVEIEPHARFRAEGRDLFADMPVAPWEAALGAAIILPTLGGDVSLSIPPGSSSGQKLRLRGHGIPLPKGEHKGAAGDLYVELRVVTPKTLNDDERAAWQKLQAASKFNPRKDW